MIAPLKWSEVREPCEECWYHHVIAETPMGRFLISWKGWKDYDSPTIDETPWAAGFFAFGVDVDDAKRIAEAEWQRVIGECLLPGRAQDSDRLNWLEARQASPTTSASMSITRSRGG